MKRREVLSAGAITAVSAALAGAEVSAAATDTPIVRLYREWHRLRVVEAVIHETDVTGNFDSPDCAAATQAALAVERQIWVAEATNSTDLLIKLGVMTCFADFDLGEAEWRDF